MGEHLRQAGSCERHVSPRRMYQRRKGSSRFNVPCIQLRSCHAPSLGVMVCEREGEPPIDSDE
jgi:hypothetical protein